MGAANTTSLWNQGVLGKKLLFTLTTGAVVKAVLILVVGLVIAKVLRKYLLSLARTTKYVWIINEDTASTLHNMVVVVALVYSLDALGVLSITVAGTSLSNILAAFLVFYFSYVLAKKSKDYIIMRSSKQKLPEVQLKAKLYYYTFVTLAFFIALNIAGLSGRLSTIVAAAGITGIVLGFASQTVVANFISGIFMYFDKPLKIGDPVEVAGYSGVVHDIRILSTRIRTWDGLLVRIPNEKLFNSDIKNLQKYPARRVDITVGIAYKEDAGRAIEVIKKTLDEMPYVLAEPEPMVFVDNLGDSSVNIAVKAWAPSEKWFDVRWQIVQKIKEALDREGIEIPFPQRVNWFAEELRVKVEKD
ncbi:small-conductance mechanosensitive channel [Thermococcus kodakarensis KOD1]|uniref:Small-conductance mechanosensitive channel n=1 Tax=Thermococcus kodakarensis (strain ATCC BAA-918 / JCM 12380 / KOD1) TaxID=69014 RepID=Q5JDP0_THEKO|nr:mechanosensitive ion channel family protein [Thermococcus kodakarensis]WCN27827.1 mechanosensitive ion channel family protein [Thermococcus kodakarensis]WCN30125.1 mechanosensitive ion channel family protein [Thermococcus kodakarensis]BAD86129.1 small-conductance mechanosensitive channel [Thermococcus kodakarensis KOD1]